MHASTLQGFLGHLRRLTDPNRSRELSDADLLERFRMHREEAAFTLLVQRHGPMVLSVCRRILGNAHDAEDAFQATFLVLIRKAGSIQRTQSLAAWLHRVACRLALKARTQSVRRQMREGEVVPAELTEDRLDALAAAELRAALDEEIERLPNKYRMPIVLCYLSDKTHEQAANALGCPKSSVTSRLARARELLQQRLLRRGFTVPVGVLAALLTEQAANAALPSLLALATVRVAVQALAGETLTATSAAVLAGSFVKSTMALKLTATLALLATLGFAAVGYRMAVPGSSPPAEQATSKAQTLGEPRAAKPEPRQPRVDLFGDPLPEEVIARMGSGRLRHPGYGRDLVFSADGKTLVSSAGDSIRIWDAATGKLRRRLDVPSDWTLSFAFTAEGILVASAIYEKGIVTLRAFDTANGKVRRCLELPDQATNANVTLSRDGKWLAYSCQNNIRLYDTANGREVLRLPMGRDIAFAPDGKTVVICDISDTIRVHDMASGKCIRRLKHEGDKVVHIALSPDGRYLASIPWNDKRQPGEFSIWDLRAGKELHRLNGAGNLVLTAAFSPDGKYVAVGCQHHHLLLFDLATGKEVRRYPTDAYFACIAFSPDGKALAAKSGEGTIRLWETETGRVLPASADPFIDAILELRFSGDGRRLIGFAAMMPIAWEPATGREIRRFSQAADHHRIALSPDESLLADADFKISEGTIRLRDAATGKEQRALKGHEKGIWRVIFSPDGHCLASSSYDGTIRVWDAASGRQLHKLAGGGDRTMSLTFSPDGRWLASASDSSGPQGRYEVILRHLTTGREKTRFFMIQNNAAHQLAFSPDSRLLAAVGGGRTRNDPGEVQVWDVASERQRLWLDGHKSRAGSVAFSPDNRMLATGDMSGKLFLWELASGRLRHRFVGHDSWITALAFSPDGRLLAASSFEAPAYVWDVLATTEQLRRSMPQSELQRCWKALAGEDASAAFQSIRRLAAAPKQTLPFLRERLKPVPPPDSKRIRRLVEMLDSNDFPTRQNAAEELENHADAAAGLLRQIVSKEKPSLEVRRRIQQILEGIENKPGTLRVIRAVEVLEWIATPEAVRLIGELANGAAEARLSREAAAARKRLRR
ncbi:MAG TPA: sigma-70 family RNA polymerase sigma factor [Gemmataceae bacterium]|nr:sigma-70 family RNA polymerase sigma factor [Gemmataceae bacterium]